MLTPMIYQERRGKIAEALTLQDDSAGLLSTSSASPRVVRYDAQAEYSAIYDPMNYGAYSRWKKAEEAVAKEKSSKQGKKKTKEGLSPDSFYNAIKNLGSGPKSNDVALFLMFYP